MIKKITREDLEFARKLRNKNRDYFFDPRKINKIIHEAWFEVMQKDPDMEFFIIWEDGKRVGTISAHETMDNVEIGNIIIDKKHRRKGYFKQALAELLIFHPGKSPFLEVKPENKAAIKAYESIGFRERKRTLWI